jgi:hypothetical protein
MYEVIENKANSREFDINMKKHLNILTRTVTTN